MKEDCMVIDLSHVSDEDFKERFQPLFNEFEIEFHWLNDWQLK